MDNATCRRPGCDHSLNKGKLYCSAKCAALDRQRKRKPLVQMSRTFIPNNVELSLRNILGDDQAAVVLQDMENVAKEPLKINPSVPTRAMQRIVEGGREGFSYEPSQGVFRSHEAISFAEIDDMLKCGPVAEALAAKLAGIRSAWRNSRSWTVYHPDEQFAVIVKKSFERTLMTFLDDMLTGLPYGTFFGNLVWEIATAEQVGVPCARVGVQPDQRVAHLTEIAGAAPETIRKIRYTAEGKFDGFEQYQKRANNSWEPVKTVERFRALVVPYKGRFRNLWGESWCEPIWALRYWYEVAIRSFVRYLERTGEPKVIAEAPMNEYIEKPGGGSYERALDAMLGIAATVSNTSAVALPSDRDDKGNKKYALSYFQDSSRSDMWVLVIRVFYALIKGAGLTGDSGFIVSEGGTKSFASEEVRSQGAAADDERIVSEQMVYLNLHLLPYYSEYMLGAKAPQPLLATAGLDRMEREVLFKLVSAAMNTEVGPEILRQVDWTETLHGIMIPTITAKEIADIKEKLEEEKLERQKQWAETQAKVAPPAETPGAPGEKDEAPGKPKSVNPGGPAFGGEQRPGRGSSKAVKE